MEILITGGAGYIGSHTVIDLVLNGFHPVVIDDFSSGHIEALKLINAFKNVEVPFYHGDIGDKGLLEKIFKEHDIRGVIHFAASSLVGESMRAALKYYENNVGKAVSLLKFLKEAGINTFIFSSSAAVYGNLESFPIEENHLLDPVNPYGFSKLVVERILKDMDMADGFKFISLRYFNAAGAYAGGIIGEDHNPETHLIPRVLKSIASGDNKAFIYGSDYSTKDGTAIRDYIHVSDLAFAHILALKYLIEDNKSKSMVYNLGCETGYSVLDILKKIEKITGAALDIEYTGRRAGDPAILVASSKKILKDLGFKFRYGIDEIISSAWKWHFTNKNGFSGV